MKSLRLPLLSLFLALPILFEGQGLAASDKKKVRLNQYLTYTPTKQESLLNIVIKLNICDSSMGDCGTWVDSIKANNPKSIIPDGKRVVANKPITIPLMRLPENAYFTVNDAQEIIPLDGAPPEPAEAVPDQKPEKKPEKKEEKKEPVVEEPQPEPVVEKPKPSPVPEVESAPPAKKEKSKAKKSKPESKPKVSKKAFEEKTKPATQPKTKSPVSPAASQVTQKADDSPRRTKLSLSPSYSLTALTNQNPAAGVTGRVNTQFNVGLRAVFFYSLNADYEAFLASQFRYLAILQPSAKPLVTITPASVLQGGFELGAQRVFWAKLSAALYFGLQNELFSAVTSSQSQTVNSVWGPSLGARLSYSAFDLWGFTLGVMGLGELKLGTSSPVTTGAHYGGSIYANRGNSYELSGGLFLRSQNTTLNQTQVDLVFSFLIYLWQYGEKSPIKK